MALNVGFGSKEMSLSAGLGPSITVRPQASYEANNSFQFTGYSKV